MLLTVDINLWSQKMVSKRSNVTQTYKWVDKGSFRVVQ